MRKPYNHNKTLEDAIVDLYLNVKIRKQEEIEIYDENFQEQEKEKLRKASPFTLIEYIKSSIEILIDLKVQEKLQDRDARRAEFDDNEDETNEYEKLLRKLESDIRTYIKIEHQLKLHSDNLQQRVEELEKQKDDMKVKSRLMSEQLSKYKSTSNYNNDDDLITYKNEIFQLQQIVKTYEEHNLKIPELEKKLRSQKLKFETEMKNIDLFYKEKIKSLTGNSKLTQVAQVANVANVSQNQNDLTSRDTIRISKERARKDNSISKERISRDNSKINYNEDPDRVNYNYLPSRNTDMSDISVGNKTKSRTHSPDVKPSATTNRIIKSSAKKEIDYISSRIDQYKKGIENKNIKNMMEDLRVKKDQSGISSRTLENNRTIETSKTRTNCDVSDITSTSKKHSKMQSTASSASSKKVESIKTMINNYNSRGNSQDKTKNKTPIGKTIYAMKDNIKASSNTSNLTNAHAPPKDPHNNNSLTHNNYMSNPKLTNSNSNSNIILNQNGVPCYNNIHIYTNGVNGIKPSDINLRQYIFNKVNKKPNANVSGSAKGQNKSLSHVRSNSTAGHN